MLRMLSCRTVQVFPSMSEQIRSGALLQAEVLLARHRLLGWKRSKAPRERVAPSPARSVDSKFSGVVLYTLEGLGLGTSQANFEASGIAYGVFRHFQACLQGLWCRKAKSRAVVGKIPRRFILCIKFHTSSIVIGHRNFFCSAGQTCLRDFRLPVEFTAMPMFEDNFDHYVCLVLGEWTIRVRRTSGFPQILVCCKKCTPHALAARGGALWQDNLAPSTAAAPAKDLDGQRIGATNEAAKFNCIASFRTHRQG